MTSLNRVVFATIPSNPRAMFVAFGAGVESVLCSSATAISVKPNSALHSRNERVRHRCWCFGDRDTSGLEGVDFSCRRPFATGDDGTGVTHPASGRRGHPGDESGDRFSAMISNPGGRFFFGGAADFAD